MSTNREEYLKRHKLSGPQSLADLAKTSKVPLKILKEVEARGGAAYKSSPDSVRMKGTYKKKKAPMSEKLTQSQWSRARTYSFLNKLEGRRRLNHDLDLAEKIKNRKK